MTQNLSVVPRLRKAAIRGLMVTCGLVLFATNSVGAQTAPAAATGTPAPQAPPPVAAPAADVARDPAGGEALFHEGRRLLKAGDDAGACAKFAESLRLDPAPGTQANLADCEERAGHTAAAWVMWRRVLDQTPPTDPRRATAQSRAEALEKVLPRLTIRRHPDAPADLVIKRDEVILGEPSLGVALPLDPGTHVVTTSARGFKEAKFVVESRPGEAKVLEISAGEALPVVPTTQPKTVELTHDLHPPTGTGRSRRWAGYAITTAGAAALGAGIYFATQARQARADAAASCARQGSPPLCWGSADPALRSNVRNAHLADVGFASGAIASAVGLYLVFSKGDVRSQSEARTAASSSVVEHRRSPVNFAWAAGPLSGGAEVQLAARF